MLTKKVIVGLSGGVDSSVAALKLVEAGHDVRGVFMQNWEANPDDPHCTAEQDLSDARAVADLLNIPFDVVNFSQSYWDRVFKHCLDEFQAGRTPNPDIGCNKEIKFRTFLDYALEQGVDAIATGHYARVDFNDNQFYLRKAADASKDQTYFLYTLGQSQLAHALFPLGDLLKSTVRAIARQHGLPNHDKKDSTGICFIGERNFKAFLQEFILNKPGDIVTTSGDVIGQHDGLSFYTLGQRKGLLIGGKQEHGEAPWYVIDKDIDRNQLVVGQNHNHPRLLRTELDCHTLEWVLDRPPALPLHCTAKTRHLQPDQDCIIQSADQDNIHVAFNTAQRAITPGQHIVFYQGDICLGGGTIR